MSLIPWCGRIWPIHVQTLQILLHGRVNLVRACSTHKRVPRHRKPGMPTKFSALIAVVAALFVLPLSAGAALAQKRVALVIGNSTYQSVARLANPINDAAAIAQMFKNAGFDLVTMRRDLGVLEFKRALREFLDAAQDAEIAVRSEEHTSELQSP